MKRPALLALLLAACTASTTPAGDAAYDGGVGDAASDASPDATGDVAADAIADGQTDAHLDATPDVTSDASDDTTPDAADDTTPDAMTDTSADAAVDTSADAAVDTSADTAPDTSADAAVDTTPDAAADTTPDAAPDTTPDAAADTTPDTIADAADVATDAGDLPELDAIFAMLRADAEGAIAELAATHGWPVETDRGLLVVDVDLDLPQVAGDFDGWTGTAMNPDAGFRWAIIPAGPGDGYKFTDGADVWVADPWSRAYAFDENGELSLIEPPEAHLERWFGVTNGDLPARRLRVWVPAEPVTHTLYAHDGQNLFDPGAPWGGWSLQAAAPAGMMIVGIDNAGEDRMFEYTPVEDVIEGLGTVGGGAARYGAFIEEVVRPLIRDAYGEGARVGVMGSSLGGLVSLYLADAYPGSYDMAISLSGTVGWGGIGASNDTIFDAYDSVGPTAIFVDSGGGPGDGCADTDGDGLNDDTPSSADNFCENRQFADHLAALGYTWETTLWHWHEPDAAHNEAAWGARVFRPLALFAGM